MKITVGVPTRNRYDHLDKTLLSLAFQTVKPYEVIIVDDSTTPVDIREISYYSYILHLFDFYKIKWKVVWGAKKGQHFSHQLVQEQAEGDVIFRIDDDCVAEPTCLELLVNNMKEDVGAIAPCVLLSNPSELPKGARNDINSMSTPNTQWFTSKGISDADHLYSCFLYRKGIVKYDLTLSPKAFREETIFTHSIKRAGWKLLVNHDAIVYHFQAPTGGIRSDNNIQDFQHDEKIFQGYLNLWGVTNDEKIIILNNGLGDHYCFKNLLPALKQKYKKLKIACCYPDIFFDEDMTGVELISIAQAQQLFGNLDMYNIYAYMTNHNWDKSLLEAFKTMYDV